MQPLTLGQGIEQQVGGVRQDVDQLIDGRAEAAASSTATVSLMTATGSTLAMPWRCSAAFNRSLTTSPSTPAVANSFVQMMSFAL